MADNFSKLSQVSLTVVDSNVSVVTAAPGETIIVRHIRVVNQSSAAVAAVTMFQTGTTTDDLILPTVDIAAGGWAEFEGTIILDPNEILYAAKKTSSTATSADLTVTVYGLKMT